MASMCLGVQEVVSATAEGIRSLAVKALPDVLGSKPVQVIFAGENGGEEVDILFTGHLESRIAPPVVWLGFGIGPKPPLERSRADSC